MPSDVNAGENLQQQLASNSARMDELVHQQYNVETTRSLMLCFSSPEEDCARTLNKVLFGKGMRVLQHDPEKNEDGRYHIRVGVKGSLRDAVREEFVRDMVQTAVALNSSYDGWNLLADQTAEQMQSHVDIPDAQPGISPTGTHS